MKKSRFKELDEFEKKQDKSENVKGEDYKIDYSSLRRPFNFGRHIYKEEDQHTDEHVPLYRSYGVMRKFGLTRKILETFYTVIATIVLVMLGFAAALTIVSAVLYSTVLISTTVVVIFLSFFLYRPVRLLCKRFGFMIKLRRYCRKRKYKLKINRRFPAYFSHSNEKTDFSVDTGNKIYHACFLTTAKRFSHVTVLDGKRIRITTRINAERNKFYQIYNIKIKHKIESFEFPSVDDTENRECVRTVILNPSPHTLFVTDKDGIDRETGTGEFVFGYHIHTASGFLNTLERELKGN